MTKYTDDQINEAIQKAAEKNTAPPVYAWEFNMYKKVIDHLPEPQGDWQSDDVKAVRKGDRVRWTVPGCEDNESYEIVVAAVTNVTTDGGVVLFTERGSYFFPYGTVVDRIPAPVVHPDPAEHPVIIIYRPNGNGETPVSYAWTGQHYRSFDGQEYFSANEITDWSPAKVVADND